MESPRNHRRDDVNAELDAKRVKDWLSDTVLAQALQSDADVVQRHVGSPGFRPEISEAADAGCTVRRLIELA
jgi:hypothetical protein